MTFEDVELPPTILLDSVPSLTWDTEIIEYGQGSSYANVRINQSRYRFNLRHVVIKASIFANLLQFFEAMGGPEVGFLITNPLDDRTSGGPATTPLITDQSLGTGDGVDTTFDLNRAYTQGGQSKNRRIWKPKSGTCLVQINTSPITTPTVIYSGSPSGGQVKLENGVATFGTAPANGATMTWGGQYFYPVRLEGTDIPIPLSGGYTEVSNLSLIEVLQL